MSDDHYYYACSYPLAPGSVVEPGNWGRILMKYTANDPGQQLLVRELIFENTRLSAFPNKPSRLEAAFVFKTRDAVPPDFLGSRRFDLLYEVELVDPSALSHKAGMNLVDWPSGESVEMLFERARRYWAGEEIAIPELVTLSPLRIVALAVS